MRGTNNSQYGEGDSSHQTREINRNGGLTAQLQRLQRAQCQSGSSLGLQVFNLLKSVKLIVNIQYACQRYFFGALADAYFDNKLRDASVKLRRSQKTIDAFNHLPEEFTFEDVKRCFSL